MKKRTFLILKVVITALSFVITVIAKSNIDWVHFSNNYIDPVLVKEIVYDLAVGVFSAMILVWFVDEINEHIQDRQSKEHEKAEIQRFDKVLQCYIEPYETFFYCVATPIEKRDFDSIAMPKAFTFRDMKDLHETSLLAKERATRGSVDTFLQIEFDLRNQFNSILSRCDFKYYPQFAEIFMEFIKVSLEYDSRSAILTPLCPTVGKKSWKEYMRDMLETHADDFYQKILRGEKVKGNLAHPYIYLYEMMNVERDLILKYNEEIKKLN